MRITYQQACAGMDAGISRFPCPNAKSITECFTDGMPDRVKLLSALAISGIQVGSNDRDAVLCFGLDFAIRFNEWMRDIMNASPESVSITAADSRGRSPVDRNMRKGRIAYARVHVSSRLSDNSIVVRVQYGNPKNVVGQAEEFSRDIAITCVQLADQLADIWNEDSRLRVVVEEHEDSKGLLTDARNDFEERMLRSKWRKCGHHRNGMCCASEDGTPPEFSCKCFVNGYCKHK